MDVAVRRTHVAASLGYLVPGRERPFNYMFQPPAGKLWHNCAYEQRPCRIRDARLLSSLMSLDVTGFQLLDAPAAACDFRDERQIRESYYPAIEGLARVLVGGTRAIVFDHLLRQREQKCSPQSFGREGENPAAVGRVHNDYTEESGRRRLLLAWPEAPTDRPFVILNFWRAVDHPAFDAPLAICDARSFPRRDWVAGDVIYPTRTGEIYLGTYSEEHDWYYYPAMQPSEVLVFKSYDSRFDSPARMTPHCAFEDPSAPEDAPPRRSIEVRCLVVLD